MAKRPLSPTQQPESDRLAHQQIVRWHIYPDADSLYERAARAVGRMSHEATSQRGAFHVVLSGGNTPRPLYERLSTLDAQWSAWHVYFGDERCLPADHPERNSAMAFSAWLDRVPIPRGQIHPIPAERGPHAAARSYGELLWGVAQFDLVLLGLGEDGHTASLFPGADWGVQPGAAATLAVEQAPKPPAQRVTLSAWRLGQTREAMVLVCGAAKHEALVAWQTGKDLPVAAVRPESGVDALLERTLTDSGLGVQ